MYWSHFENNCIYDIVIIVNTFIVDLFIIHLFIIHLFKRHICEPTEVLIDFWPPDKVYSKTRPQWHCYTKPNLHKPWLNCAESLSPSSSAVHSNPQHRDALPEQGAGWAVSCAASQRDILCKKVFMSLCQVPPVLPECVSGLYWVLV